MKTSSEAKRNAGRMVVFGIIIIILKIDGLFIFDMCKIKAMKVLHKPGNHTFILAQPIHATYSSI